MLTAGMNVMPRTPQTDVELVTAVGGHTTFQDTLIGTVSGLLQVCPAGSSGPIEGNPNPALRPGRAFRDNAAPLQTSDRSSPSVFSKTVENGTDTNTSTGTGIHPTIHSFTAYREPRTLHEELKAVEGKRKETPMTHYEGIPLSVIQQPPPLTQPSSTVGLSVKSGRKIITPKRLLALDGAFQCLSVGSPRPRSSASSPASASVASVVSTIPAYPKSI